MKICINRSDALGDILLTLPMAQIIKENWPLSKIYFIVSKKAEDLLTDNPYIDGYLTLEGIFFQDSQHIRDFLIDHKIDHYIHVGGSNLPSWWALLLGLEIRGGQINKFYHYFLFNKGLRQKRSKVCMHEAEYNISLLSPLGLEKFEKSKIIPPIFLKRNHKFHLKKYIVIHPGMTGHTLNWPKEHYIQLISYLKEKVKSDHKTVISYTTPDIPYIEEILSKFSNDDFVYFYDGSKEGLKNYIDLLQGASFFIGPSTGPTHMANILNIPLAAIYSPIMVQSKERWGPYYYSSKTTVFSPQVNCQERFNCIGPKCPHFFCMQNISVSKLGLKVIQGIEATQ